MCSRASGFGKSARRAQAASKDPTGTYPCSGDMRFATAREKSLEACVMQFAMYLVDNGVISCEEFFEALKLQLHSRPQLGALAIETRRLSFRQVFAILRTQCDEPNELFGEIAVRLGFLTQDDVAQLLAEQNKRA